LEPDETIQTPVSTPGVSHNPITTLAGRISSKLDGVIDGVSALGSIEDTSSVVLPWLSIAADGERSGLKSLVDGRLRSSNRVDSVNVKGRSARRLHAVAVLGSVGVASFSILTTLGFDPAHGLTRITSGAAIIIGIAVNNFLRSEDPLGLASEQVGRFDGLGGGESPAGSALFLVLDGGNDTGGLAPITRGRGSSPGDGGFVHAAFRGEVSGNVFEEGGLELFRGQVHELGDTEDIAVLHLVHFVDEAEVLVENLDGWWRSSTDG